MHLVRHLLVHLVNMAAPALFGLLPISHTAQIVGNERGVRPHANDRRCTGSRARAAVARSTLGVRQCAQSDSGRAAFTAIGLRQNASPHDDDG